MIFADTSAFYALADGDDRYHSRAREILETFLEGKAEIVTHNYILTESFALFHRRLGMSAVKKFYLHAHSLCRIIWVSQSQHERAAKTFVGQDGSRYSFVDCVSFEIMKSHGIKRYFAFDDDFRRPGLEPA